MVMVSRLNSVYENLPVQANIKERETVEIKQAIAELRNGVLVIKKNYAIIIGFGRKFKEIK
jgi:hypothetical protein